MKRMKSPTVAGFIENYVKKRRETSSPISIKEAVTAARHALANCELNDRELAALITDQAVRFGPAVIFDAKLPPISDGRNGAHQ